MNNKTIVCITCTRRDVNTMLGELTEQFGEARGEATVLLYGATSKEQVGFMVLACNDPVSPEMAAKFQNDPDVMDYLITESSQLNHLLA